MIMKSMLFPGGSNYKGIMILNSVGLLRLSSKRHSRLKKDICKWLFIFLSIPQWKTDFDACRIQKGGMGVVYGGQNGDSIWEE